MRLNLLLILLQEESERRETGGCGHAGNSYQPRTKRKNRVPMAQHHYHRGVTCRAIHPVSQSMGNLWAGGKGNFCASCSGAKGILTTER